jgi:nucleobase:cation symporter-1, NCS1 family
MVLYTFVGIAVTSASAVLFGHPIWNPIQLIGAFHQPVVAFVALIAVLVATLNVNIGANVVSPSNDFSNLYPRLISFRTGGLITGFLGLAMCPWKLLATPDAYIFGWLVGYSGCWGRWPESWCAITFSFANRAGCELALSPRGRISLHQRASIRARCCAGAGRGDCAGRVFVKPLHFLYDYAWFVGFFTAGACMWR